MTSPEVCSDLFEDFAKTLKRPINSGKVMVDPEKVEQGLVNLVLSLVEFLRQLLEKQAIRRIEAGTLNDEEIDRLGATLMKLEEKIKELQEYFEIDDLNIDLGPLGNLID